MRGRVGTGVGRAVCLAVWSARTSRVVFGGNMELSLAKADIAAHAYCGTVPRVSFFGGNRVEIFGDIWRYMGILPRF